MNLVSLPQFIILASSVLRMFVGLIWKSNCLQNDYTTIILLLLLFLSLLFKIHWLEWCGDEDTVGAFDEYVIHAAWCKHF